MLQRFIIGLAARTIVKRQMHEVLRSVAAAILRRWRRICDGVNYMSKWQRKAFHMPLDP